MKHLFLFSLALLLLSGLASCNAQSSQGVQNSVHQDQTSPAELSDKVAAYYFHFTSRCVTCKAIEAEAKANLENLYGGKVPFKSINLDEASSRMIAEMLQVSGQSLLLVKGKQIINITNEGFMYARTDPEKFRSIIKENVDRLL